jgi:hypothetical protein
MNPMIMALVVFGLLGFGSLVIIAIYLYMERNKNQAKSVDHCWFMIIPKAGKERNFRVPIEHNGGVTFAKVPDIHGKITDNSPIHVMGEDGEFQSDYPPGKMKFVQATMQKIVYYEGDAEPLSNVSNIPIVSGQLLASLINGLTAATAEVVRKSGEQGGQSTGKNSGMIMYILVGIGIIASIVAAIFAVKAAGISVDIKSLELLVKQALGLK